MWRVRREDPICAIAADLLAVFFSSRALSPSPSSPKKFKGREETKIKQKKKARGEKTQHKQKHEDDEQADNNKQEERKPRQVGSKLQMPA